MPLMVYLMASMRVCVPMRMCVRASGGLQAVMRGLVLLYSLFLLMFVCAWWSRSKARNKANKSLVNIILIIGQSLKADFRPYFVA